MWIWHIALLMSSYTYGELFGQLKSHFRPRKNATLPIFRALEWGRVCRYSVGYVWVRYGWHRCKRTRQQFLIHTCAFREKYCVRLDKARRGTICSTFIIIFFLLSFLFLLFLCQEFKKILSKIWCFTIRLYAVKCVSSTFMLIFKYLVDQRLSKNGRSLKFVIATHN